MAEYIENRPVSCSSCGNYPVYGQESSTEVKDGTLLECRWTCPRCGNLVRVDEKVVSKDVEK